MGKEGNFVIFVCVSVCERERERGKERKRECVHECAHARKRKKVVCVCHVCVGACVSRVCVCVCVIVCVCTVCFNEILFRYPANDLLLLKI